MFLNKKYNILILSGILIDQFTKFLFDKLLMLGEQIFIVPDYISIQLVHNYGAAYGIFQQHRMFLLTLAFIVIFAGIVFHKKIAVDRVTSLGLSFLMMGTVGNLIDRLWKGYVVDFVNIKIFPVFNFADVFINIGILFFLFDMIRNLDVFKSKN